MIARVLGAIRGLVGGRAMRSTLSLVAGSALAKIVGLLAMPVLTRLYSPQDFGRVSVFISVTTIIGAVLSLRYVVALPLPRSSFRARTLLLINLVFIATGLVLTSAVLFCLATFFGHKLLDSGSDGFWLAYWWLIPVGSGGIAIYELTTMWATRDRRYREISISQVWQSITGTSAKIIGGALLPGSLSLVAGQVAQQSGGVFRLLPDLASSARRGLKYFRPSHFTAVIYRYSEFALYKLPAHFTYSLSAQTPILFSSNLWGASVTGQLGLAFQAIALPLALISQNASRVYYAELARIGTSDRQKALGLTKHMALRLSALGIAIGVSIFFAAPPVFQALFGQEWRSAGDFARALAIYIPFQFVASPLINAYNIYGNQRNVLFVHLVRMVLAVSVFVLSGQLGLGAVETIYIYSLVVSLDYAVVCLNVVRLIRGPQGE